MDIILVMVFILIGAYFAVSILQWLLKVFKKRFRRCLHITTFHLILILSLISVISCFAMIIATESTNILFQLCFFLNSKLLWTVDIKQSSLFTYTSILPLMMYYVYELNFKSFPTKLMNVSVGINSANFSLFYLAISYLKFNLAALFILAVMQLYHLFMEYQLMITKHVTVYSTKSNILILLSSILNLFLWLYVYIAVIPFLYIIPFWNEKLNIPLEKYLFVSYYIVEMLLYSSPIDYLIEIYRCIKRIYNASTYVTIACSNECPDINQNEHCSDTEEIETHT